MRTRSKRIVCAEHDTHYRARHNYNNADSFTRCLCTHTTTAHFTKGHSAPTSSLRRFVRRRATDSKRLGFTQLPRAYPTSTQTHRLVQMSCRIEGGRAAAGGDFMGKACFVLPSSPLLPPPSIHPQQHCFHRPPSPWLVAAAPPLPAHAVSPLFPHKHSQQHPERQPPEGRKHRWKPSQVCVISCVPAWSSDI